MEYTIVRAKTLDTVIRNVVRFLRSGWRPCGGLAFGDEYWAQALVRDPLAAMQHKDNGREPGGR